MSNEAITWSLRVKLPRGNSTAKHLLFILANQANGDPSRGVPMLTHPSIAYIVAVTDMDRKTVILNLQKLQEWGLISDTGRRCGKTGQVVIYEMHTGPDLLTAIEVKESRNRNSSNTGTVPKSEQFQSAAETVPISAGKGPDIGTRNQEQPSGTNISPAGARDDVQPPDRTGQFEGHADAQWGTPPPAAAVAIAVELRKRGYAITARDPKLLEAVEEGVTPPAVFEFADMFPADHVKCRGSPGYVLSAARRQRAENAHRANSTTKISRGTHAPASRSSESAVDRAARRARDILTR